MNNKVDLTSKINDETSVLNSGITEEPTLEVTEQITELCEDMEMVSPGAMLSEARKALSFSEEYIASKLNFTLTLVKEIESDNFETSLPVTFIRGYLTNYAKLVNVDVEDILASYNALDAATIQRSEMLSFSKQTSKQAEYSLVMWLSYLIVAVLIGLTILWWQQENSQQTQDVLDIIPINSIVKVETIQSDTAQKPDVAEKIVSEENLSITTEVEQPISNQDIIEATSDTDITEANQPLVPVLSTAVFTFKGDCWVNIFDANGKRIAWGVKKAGYVMTIEGKEPLRITVGKPELTSIVFNGQPVDMSTFNLGNIAKFNLPIGEYSAN